MLMPGYAVATVSSIHKIIGLFCKRDLYKRRYSAEETYDYIDPTDRSHPITGDYRMGWLRFVGSLQLYVSFANEPYKQAHILQKRPVI